MAALPRNPPRAADGIVGNHGVTAVQARDLAHQRQAEAGAALVPRRPGEGREDPGAFRTRNPVAQSSTRNVVDFPGVADDDADRRLPWRSAFSRRSRIRRRSRRGSPSARRGRREIAVVIAAFLGGERLKVDLLGRRRRRGIEPLASRSRRSAVSSSAISPPELGFGFGCGLLEEWRPRTGRRRPQLVDYGEQRPVAPNPSSSMRAAARLKLGRGAPPRPGLPDARRGRQGHPRPASRPHTKNSISRRVGHAPAG